MSASSLAEFDERTEARVGASSAHERLSPFLEWSETDRRGITQGDLASAPRSLLVDLVQDPAALVKRLEEAGSARETVLTAAGVVAASTSAFALAIAHLFGLELGGPVSGSLRLAAVSALASADVLLALAASLGPIYGASILLAARIPLRSLVAILLCSAATGSLLLAALAPVMVGLWRVDPTWIGPTSLLVAFLLGAAVAGVRVRRLTLLFAEKASGRLVGGDLERARTLARVALLVTSFNGSLAFLAFDTFLRW